MSKIFGGSKRTEKSYNQAYGDIKSGFSPMFGLASSGADQVQKLLGGDASGFNAYKSATGFDALSEMGSRGITGNAAARGLLRSGSTGKSLYDYGNTMNNQYASQYLDKLMGLSGLGLQAGGLVANAGQTSESKAREKPGLTGLIGSITSGIAASDRRLKKNIKKVGMLPNGLDVYTFDYIWGERSIGVMADEVAKIRPEALGPVIGGYATVDYAKL